MVFCLLLPLASCLICCLVRWVAGPHRPGRISIRTPMVIHSAVRDVRATEAEEMSPGVQQIRIPNPLVEERIRQLSERTRICSRRVWEEVYFPELRKEDEDAKPDLEVCCICMSDIAMSDQIRGLACGHIFHLRCLAEWFMRDRTFELCCPLCRVPLPEQRRFQDCRCLACTEVHGGEREARRC